MSSAAQNWTHRNPANIVYVILYKGKAILAQAYEGTEGSRRMRFPDFKTNGTLSW
jgi:hypothetical protein